MTTDVGARFSLRIPETWFEFDVWRATRTGDLARLVDERLAELPELRPQRAVILKALRQFAEEAERKGAVYSAACADRVQDGHLLASLTVFTTAGLPEPALNTVEAIAAQLTSSRDEGSVREVRVIELNAGRAVRVRAVGSLMGEGGNLPLVTMQTLIPVPGGEGVLDVVLTSPHVDFAEPLLDLFDAISGTLAWQAGPSPR
jgi:hypothetical protein